MKAILKPFKFLWGKFTGTSVFMVLLLFLLGCASGGFLAFTHYEKSNARYERKLDFSEFMREEMRKRLEVVNNTNNARVLDLHERLDEARSDVSHYRALAEAADCTDKVLEALSATAQSVAEDVKERARARLREKLLGNSP